MDEHALNLAHRGENTELSVIHNQEYILIFGFEYSRVDNLLRILQADVCFFHYAAVIIRILRTPGLPKSEIACYEKHHNNNTNDGKNIHDRFPFL
jgi:hypothetical protein